MTKRILLLNGAVRGSGGNTAALFHGCRRHLPVGVEAHELVLAEYTGTVEALAEEIRHADAFVVGTGVYWGTWGSPLQRFFEVMTSLEASPAMLGKPAGVLVTVDSVGGADLAQRLVGVLSLFGCLIPPLPMVVVSRLGTEAAESPGNEDVWQLDDVRILLANLVVAMEATRLPWVPWPLTRTRAVEGAYPSGGALDLGVPRFLIEDSK